VARTLHDGLLKDSASAPATLGTAPAGQAEQMQAAYDDARGKEPQSDSFELLFTLSNVYDGRYANNGWLQELADPDHQDDVEKWPRSVRKRPSDWVS